MNKSYLLAVQTARFEAQKILNLYLENRTVQTIRTVVGIINRYLWQIARTAGIVGENRTIAPKAVKGFKALIQRGKIAIASAMTSLQGSKGIGLLEYLAEYHPGSHRSKRKVYAIRQTLADAGLFQIQATTGFVPGQRGMPGKIVNPNVGLMLAVAEALEAELAMLVPVEEEEPETYWDGSEMKVREGDRLPYLASHKNWFIKHLFELWFGVGYRRKYEDPETGDRHDWQPLFGFVFDVCDRAVEAVDLVFGGGGDRASPCAKGEVCLDVPF